MPAIRLYALMEHEDDPKRCTAAKLVRFKKVLEVSGRVRIPHSAIVLDPEAEQALSRDDFERASRFGLVVLDCSWNKLSKFPEIRRGLHHRALPFLLAANPTNFGKPQKLSSAEALAASLYIMGDEVHAAELMNLFKWGPVFLKINHERLDAYAASANSSEVVEAQERMLQAVSKQ